MYLLCGLLQGNVYAGGAIHIDHAWIPEGPPVIKILAGYFVVTNSTDNTVSIVNASCPDFNKVEMHESVTKAGRAHMVKKQSVSIEAHSKTEFKSGGLHLMLIGAKRKLKAGDSVPLAFTLSNGEIIKVKATVKKPDMAIMDHSHHNH